MKKILLLLLSAIMLAGCSQADNESVTTGDNSIVLPPSRVGNSTCDVLLAKDYTFETAFLESDAVARVKVGNWLSENTEIDSTYFEATTLECFKGDVPKKFILMQPGDSEETIEGFPLFTHGNELLLFLNHETDPDYESFYWLNGSYTTVFDVVYDNEGNRYYGYRYIFLGETIDISVNYAHDKDTYSEIFRYAAKSDSLVAERYDRENFQEYLYKYVFSEADINGLINKYLML